MVTVPNKNNTVEPMTPFQEEIKRSRKVIKSFKAKADKNRSFTERFADWMTGTFGTVHFLIINVIVFAIWIIINSRLIPGIPVFDPFPHGYLTTIVSLEAIVLAIFVLISQNRQTKVDELREEVNYQIGIISEKEITKILTLLTKIAEKNKIDLSKDEILEEMLQPTNTESIEKALEKQMGTGTPILPLKFKIPQIPEPPNPIPGLKKFIIEEEKSLTK
jgi:uncharacterized membrane protein